MMRPHRLARPLVIVPLVFVVPLVFGVLLFPAAAGGAEEPLPSDPRLLQGTLANGVKWIGRPNAVPPGKMAMLLRIDVGSLQETEEQRGLAHFLVHMAFRSSENFGPGAIVSYYQSLGMDSGPDVNVISDFDQTVYFLSLPSNTPEQLERACTAMSDFAFRMVLMDREIDQERGTVLTEYRTGITPQMRVRDKLFEKLFEGMRVSQRLPIGTERTIVGAPRLQFLNFMRAWYRPENMTVIWAGDTTSEVIVPLLEKWFGQFRAAGQPGERVPSDLRSFDRQRVLVVAEPQVSQCDVDLYQLFPNRPPRATYAQARRDVMEEMVNWIIGRRFSEQIKQGKTTCRSAYSQVSDFGSDARLLDICTAGDPNDWKKLLEELVVEVRRAHEHGFVPGEVELCKSDLLANQENATRREADRPSANIVSDISNSLRRNEPVLSAAQRLEVIQKILPTVSAEELNKLFRESVQLDSMAYVITTPKKEGSQPPTEEEITAAIAEAKALPVERPRDVKRPSDLTLKLPEPGKLEEVTRDEELGVSSGWLSNGARVHHRFMDQKRDWVTINIVLAGGQIEETADNVGITQAAARIFSQPATMRLTSTELQDALIGSSVTVNGGAEDDLFLMSLACPPKELDLGLMLVHALLTEGKVEATAVENWKQQAGQNYTMASKLAQFAAFDAFVDALTGDDPRRPILLTPEQLDKITLEATQAWYSRICKEAPMEIAVVGDMQLTDVQPLLEKYLGSLPKRPRQADHLARLRESKRAPGPLTRQAAVEGAPQGWAVNGFAACNLQAVPDVRALNLASNVLNMRLARRLRQELNIVYSVECQNRPGGAYLDSGHFLASAACAPEKVAQVNKEISAVYAAFAENGPTEDELAFVKKRLTDNLANEISEPPFWLGCLSTLDLRGLTLDAFRNFTGAYEAITPDVVRDTFRKYYVPERTIVVAGISGPPVATQRATATAPAPAPTPAKN